MEHEKEPLNIVDLNADCLECIFQWLHELPSQLHCARVCRRFRCIIWELWQRNNNYHTLCLEGWRDWFLDEQDLIYFLHAMREHLVAIQINDDCLSAFLKDLEDLGITHLPSVEHLEVQECSFCLPNDEDIFAFTKLLPNLKFLRLMRPLSGRYLVDFQLLEELHLYTFDEDKEYEIEGNNLRDILTNLKNLRVLDVRNYEMSYLRLSPHIAQCEKLETLKLNLNALKPAMNDVLQLPNLKKLTVLLDNVIDVSLIQNVDTHDYKLYETDEFYRILAEKSECIIGLAMDNYFMPLQHNWDDNLEFLSYNKLQKFALCNCDYDGIVAFDMLVKYAKMSKLEILCCRNWPQLTNDTILQFVEMCPHLVHLDISYCKKLSKMLLYDTLKILQKQKRSTTLIIYHLLSGVEYEVETNLDFWRTQTLIKFSSDFPPNSDLGLSYVYRGYEFDFE